jgi:S-adenosylmethionine/arginine decarboxylase-like enzyme
MNKLNHKHILVTARGLKSPPQKPKEVKKWLKRLVKAVKMKVFFGPEAKYCESSGNVGVTGIVGLETSHASIHCWHECQVPFLKMDLYSCDDFTLAAVMGMMKEFEPAEVEYMIVDRNEDKKDGPLRQEVIETGFILESFLNDTF